MERCLDHVTWPDSHVTTGLRVSLQGIDRTQGWIATGEYCTPRHIHCLLIGSWRNVSNKYLQMISAPLALSAFHQSPVAAH